MKLKNSEILYIEEMVKKFVKSQHRKDFLQDLYLTLLELPEEQLEELRSSSRLFHYTYGILRNQYWSNNSAFYKKYVDWERRRKDIE